VYIFKVNSTLYLDEAVDLYIKKTGIEPTVILVRLNEMTVPAESPILIRSPFGAAGIVLVTHLVSREDIENRDAVWEMNHNAIPLDPIASLEDSDLEMKQPIIKKARPGRPKKPKAVCPHCKGLISDFNNLGWWYGWELGIEPPYWEALRLAVFRRDDFTCQRCFKKFGMSGLVCHHRQYKERGGSDSARNLITLCKECDLDSRPIFPDDEL